MSGNDAGHGGYVDRVREETQAYVRKLLGENDSLRVVLAGLDNENTLLKQEIRIAHEDAAMRKTQEEILRERMQQIKSESEQSHAQYALLELHNTNLANLYVASYQLHGTLDRAVVLGAMQEIIIN